MAALDAARRSNHPHECQRDCRLAGAGLPHKSEALLWLQLEIDAIDRLHWPTRRVVVDLQIFDVENRLHIFPCWWRAILTQRTWRHGVGAHRRALEAQKHPIVSCPFLSPTAIEVRATRKEDAA